MTTLTLSTGQAELAALPANRRIFLEGPAGSGKTTAAVARMMAMLRGGVAGGRVLVVLPQRTLATPYQQALRGRGAPASSEVTILTVVGLGQRMIHLFWPLVAEAAGFAEPKRRPGFLTLETAQYYMARIARPLLNDGYFDAVNIDRNRLYSQILDNLNKAAVVGFPYVEIGQRLKSAWVGDPVQLRVYDEAQDAATRFREFCLAHNLLDFSLQYEMFARHLWTLGACRNHLFTQYRHLIVDNAEEDTPVSHDVMLEWLPNVESALIVYDTDAGYRRFLGADPQSAYRLRYACDERLAFTTGLVQSEEMAALTATLRRTLRPKPAAAGQVMMGRPNALVVAEDMELFAASPMVREPAVEPAQLGTPGRARVLEFDIQRFHPQMLDWVAGRIDELVHRDGVAPGRIAVLSPFVGGALRFSLENRLASLDVAVRSHRPSRALREEPVTRCLLTLASLCHPRWGRQPQVFDVAHMLMLSIANLDLVRAQLLADIAYRVRDGVPVLTSFAELEEEVQERITFLLGGRYEGLRTWVAANTQADDASPVRGRKRTRREAELDHFLARLFGELLSQPGYGFHESYDAGEITAKVIESARKFRQVMSTVAAPTEQPLGQEYIELVDEGVVAAQYLRSWQRQPQDAVLIAPAHTFLMGNEPVDHQFWLDIGSPAWWERLNQPLTHPYVLSRSWQANVPWTDQNEIMARHEALSDLAIGLARRCKAQIHLALADLGESGAEHRGTFLRAMQQVLRQG